MDGAAGWSWLTVGGWVVGTAGGTAGRSVELSVTVLASSLYYNEIKELVKIIIYTFRNK